MLSCSGQESVGTNPITQQAKGRAEFTWRRFHHHHDPLSSWISGTIVSIPLSVSRLSVYKMSINQSRRPLLQVYWWRERTHSRPIMALRWCGRVLCRLPAAWFPLLFSSLLWQTVSLPWWSKITYQFYRFSHICWFTTSGCAYYMPSERLQTLKLIVRLKKDESMLLMN